MSCRNVEEILKSGPNWCGRYNEVVLVSKVSLCKGFTVYEMLLEGQYFDAINMIHLMIWITHHPSLIIYNKQLVTSNCWLSMVKCFPFPPIRFNYCATCCNVDVFFAYSVSLHPPLSVFFPYHKKVVAIIIYNLAIVCHDHLCMKSCGHCIVIINAIFQKWMVLADFVFWWSQLVDIASI